MQSVLNRFKHLSGKHDQSAHGKPGRVGTAFRGAYSAARAGGSGHVEARNQAKTAAEEVRATMRAERRADAIANPKPKRTTPGTPTTPTTPTTSRNPQMELQNTMASGVIERRTNSARLDQIQQEMAKYTTPDSPYYSDDPRYEILRNERATLRARNGTLESDYDKQLTELRKQQEQPRVTTPTTPATPTTPTTPTRAVGEYPRPKVGETVEQHLNRLYDHRGAIIRKDDAIPREEQMALLSAGRARKTNITPAEKAELDKAAREIARIERKIQKLEVSRTDQARKPTKADREVARQEVKANLPTELVQRMTNNLQRELNSGIDRKTKRNLTKMQRDFYTLEIKRNQAELARRGITTKASTTKHLPGKHDQSAHGKPGRVGTAFRGAYSAARAGGASHVEARNQAKTAAEEVRATMRDEKRAERIANPKPKQATPNKETSDRQASINQYDRENIRTGIKRSLPELIEIRSQVEKAISEGKIAPEHETEAKTYLEFSSEPFEVSIRKFSELSKLSIDNESSNNAIYDQINARTAALDAKNLNPFAIDRDNQPYDKTYGPLLKIAIDSGIAGAKNDTLDLDSEVRRLLPAGTPEATAAFMVTLAQTTRTERREDLDLRDRDKFPIYISGAINPTPNERALAKLRMSAYVRPILPTTRILMSDWVLEQEKNKRKKKK